MADELERKFLVDKSGDWIKERSTSHFEIKQGYANLECGQSESRLRKKKKRIQLFDDEITYLLTFKLGSGAKRNEFETSLSSTQFDDLWEATDGRRVYKNRYKIPIGPDLNLIADVDVFKKDYQGLKTVEVEFETEHQMNEFKPPDWFGPEVTGDKTYSNSYLAIHCEID